MAVDILFEGPDTRSPAALARRLALVLALVEEPVLYDETGRGGAIAALLLSEIGRARLLPYRLPMPSDPRVARVCKALLDRPEDDRTLDAWAESAGASARTLARLFEREVGLGFAAWRQRMRLYRATEALAAGEPIATVALPQRVPLGFHGSWFADE